MIREANKRDKQSIYELWKHSYPSQNRNSLNFYFKNVFNNGMCIVKEQDNRIVSSIQMNEHVLRFAGRRLNVSFIFGVSTLPDYRRRGHMHQLMLSILDEASHNHLFTFVKAFNPKLYKPYGFETIYYTKEYTIHQEHLAKISNICVHHNAEAKELLHVYRKFTAHFDGYYVRDLDYFTTFLNQILLEQKTLLVYRNEKDEVLGYLVSVLIKDEVHVVEAVYLESMVLMRMLKVAIQDRDELVLKVSLGEKLEKIFPLLIAKRQQGIMAKLNNYDLFNKLYNSEVKSVKEAYQLIKKPLWLCEDY